MNEQNIPKLVSISRILANGIMYIGYTENGERVYINSAEAYDYYRGAPYNQHLEAKNYDHT